MMLEPISAEALLVENDIRAVIVRGSHGGVETVERVVLYARTVTWVCGGWAVRPSGE